MQRLARCLSAIAAMCVMSVVDVLAEDNGFAFIDPASPVGKRAIELALPEFRKNVPDMETYKITIARMRDGVGVLFCEPGNPGDMLGCSEEGESFEVHLDPDATRVIEAHFSR